MTEGLELPPFTFDPTELFNAIVRLANDADQSWRFTKKGDKRPRYDVEAQQKSAKANKAKKRSAAIERTLAEAAKRNLRRAPAGGSIPDRMLKAMQPGEWYGMGDLARMAGVDRTGRGKVHQVLVRRGWVERARNPAYSARQLNPWEIMAGDEPQPLNLYRLTAAGSEKRNKLVKS